MGTDTNFPDTLWDLIPTPADQASPASSAAVALPPNRSAQERYDQLVIQMKQTYRVRVVRWRKSMTGCAWIVDYQDNSIANLIESPYPRGPVSCAVFLHEIGHHAIGFYRYKPRCYEEYMAWQWAIEKMESEGFNITERVKLRVKESIQWSVEVAMNRGLKNLPKELTSYTPQTNRTKPLLQKAQELISGTSAQKQFDSYAD